MSQQPEIDELRSAWRALRAETHAGGWRTIPVASGAAGSILAGPEFPGNEEALLVGFKGVSRPRAGSLPGGYGFAVISPDLGKELARHTWIALTRQADGDFDLFIMMAGDLVRVLNASFDAIEKTRFEICIARILAWQSFMQSNSPRVLGPEAEVGLAGELEVLNALLDAGMKPAYVVHSWQGPRRGLHDFALQSGAIEVKSTTAQDSFPARISNLDQLDDATVNPLFLAAVKFKLTSAGRSLPERVNRLRMRLGEDYSMRADLDSRLVQAGFLDDASDHYVRRFEIASLGLLRVNEGFPRLTSGSVPSQIRHAAYELNLDAVANQTVALTEALSELGVAI